MKTFLKKYARLGVILGLNLVMVIYTVVMALLFFTKLGHYDDWKIANYCYFNIDAQVLDSQSSLVESGEYIYYEYQHQNEEYGYQESIRFTSSKQYGNLGSYTDPTFLYGCKGEIRISFTLSDTSIYKLEFTDIKVSESNNDDSPNSLAKSDYQVSSKNNVYALKYRHTDKFYIYSVSILYLVKKA